MNKTTVAMSNLQGSDYPYPVFPFNPSEGYPEYDLKDICEFNPVYAGVRDCFQLLCLDHERFGSSDWNPLGEFIAPGQQVLLKPNWVRHYHGSGGDIYSVITHPSLIRAVLDYVLIALKGSGKIIIGDAPIQSADMQELIRITQVDNLVSSLPCSGVDIEILDFRESVCVKNEGGHLVAHEAQRGDPRGCYRVELGHKSALTGIEQHSKNFRVTNYDPQAMNSHHASGHHEYLISGTVLSSDVVINIPKLKTHGKAGLTGCLKNLVGINGSKEYLPHHRVGALDDGGDEYSHRNLWKHFGALLLDSIEARPGQLFNKARYTALRVCRRMAITTGSDPCFEGNWYGNDTIWRTVLDLNHILKFANVDGVLDEAPQRQIFHIVDGLIIGSGNGPLRPDSVNAGIILAGQEAALIDTIAARLVGLDPEKIPLLRNALDRLKVEDFDLQSSGLLTTASDKSFIPFDVISPILYIVPPDGWKGHIELSS